MGGALGDERVEVVADGILSCIARLTSNLSKSCEFSTTQWTWRGISRLNPNDAWRDEIRVSSPSSSVTDSVRRSYSGAVPVLA